MGRNHPQGAVTLDLNELLVKRQAATHFVRFEGNSMVGAGIRDGDLLVVDRSLRPADDDVIIACVDGDFTVKTYSRDKDGVRLEPANPEYSVIRLRPGQELDKLLGRHPGGASFFVPLTSFLRTYPIYRTYGRSLLKLSRLALLGQSLFRPSFLFQHKLLSPNSLRFLL